MLGMIRLVLLYFETAVATGVLLFGDHSRIATKMLTKTSYGLSNSGQ